MAQRGYGYQQSGGYGAPPPSYGAQSAYGSYGGAATSSVPSYSQPPPSYSQPAPSYSQQPRQQQPGYQQVNRGAPAPSYQSYGGGYAQNPGPSHVSASSGGGSSHGSGSLGDIQYLQVRPSFSAPDRLPEVQEMTRHALERADNNEEEIEKIASGSRILSQASKEKRKLEEGISKSQRVVEELSEKKRQLEADLMKLDNDSIEVRSSVEQKSRLQDEAKKRFSREVQLAKLKEALKEAESTAEQIADNFLSGTMSCDDFLSDYPEWRERQAILGLRKQAPAR